MYVHILLVANRWCKKENDEIGYFLSKRVIQKSLTHLYKEVNITQIKNKICEFEISKKYLSISIEK